MKKCYLHIGSPKTGTTTIQYVLGNNRDFFAKNGILVPQSGQTVQGSHTKLAHAMGGFSVPPEYAMSVEQLSKEIRESKLDTVVISSESMFGMLQNAEKSESIFNTLKGLDLDITMVLYLRNQPQLCNSSYSQGIKTFRHGNSFQEHFRNRSADSWRYEYSRWLEIRDRYSCELVVRPFSPSVRKNLVDDFVKVLGITSTPVLDDRGALNESAGPLRVALARRLYRKLSEEQTLTTLQANLCTRLLRRVVAKEVPDDEGYSGLTADRARRIEDECRPQNDRLAHAVWGRSWAEAFESDVGKNFTPNDYGIVGIPEGKVDIFGKLYRRLLKRLQKELTSPFLLVSDPWNKLKMGERARASKALLQRS